MYIRPRQLWWLVPIFIGLFCVGMVFAHLTDKPQASPKKNQIIDENKRLLNDRDKIVELMKQLETNQELPFKVLMKEQAFSGRFRGETFELTGEISGHVVKMKRDEKTFTVTIDGEEQDPLLVPYALYTPYEHLMLVKGQLQEITPLPLHDVQQDNWQGYQFTFPPSELKALLSLWLGPRFSAEDVMDELIKHVNVDYEVWYDVQTDRLQELVVTLKLDSPQGKKQDQLLFRF
jgi:hypothetical protein